MMQLKQYLLSIIVAPIIVAIIGILINNKSKNHKAIQLICSIFIILTFLSPFSGGIHFDITSLFDQIQHDGQLAATEGTNAASIELQQIITEETEAYIRDKATSLGVELYVCVTLSTNNPPTPNAVTLDGQVSPYAKSKLSDIIARDIGIPEDQQIWR